MRRRRGGRGGAVVYICGRGRGVYRKSRGNLACKARRCIREGEGISACGRRGREAASCTGLKAS